MGCAIAWRRGALVDPERVRDRLAAGRLRNLLFHGYAELDDRRVYAALDRLEDLRSFADAALRATGGD